MCRGRSRHRAGAARRYLRADPAGWGTRHLRSARATPPHFQVHVLSAAVGYGACGVAAGLALARVLGARGPAAGADPGVEYADRTIERTIAWALLWLTLSLLTGAIWAQAAWGRYWGWDPKESWALITWLWFLLVLHLRGIRRWRGVRLAALVVAGFVIVLFTFAGLPWLVRTVRLTTLHGF